MKVIRKKTRRFVVALLLCLLIFAVAKAVPQGTTSIYHDAKYMVDTTNYSYVDFGLFNMYPCNDTFNQVWDGRNINYVSIAMYGNGDQWIAGYSSNKVTHNPEDVLVHWQGDFRKYDFIDTWVLIKDDAGNREYTHFILDKKTPLPYHGEVKITGEDMYHDSSSNIYWFRGGVPFNIKSTINKSPQAFWTGSKWINDSNVYINKNDLDFIEKDVKMFNGNWNFFHLSNAYGYMGYNLVDNESYGHSEFADNISVSSIDGEYRNKTISASGRTKNVNMIMYVKQRAALRTITDVWDFYGNNMYYFSEFDDYKNRIGIDSIAPTGVFSPNTSVFSTPSLTVSFNPSDEGSGVEKWWYRVSTDDGRTYGQWSAAINGDTTSNIILTPTSGVETKFKIQVEVWDKVHNGTNVYVTSETYNYVIPLIPPTAVINGSTPIAKGTNPNITGANSFANTIGSYITNYDWSYSSDNGSSYTSTGSTAPNVIKDLVSANEKYHMYRSRLRVMDNKSQWSAYVYKDFIVYNPNTKPTSNFNIATEVTENQDIGFVDLSSPVDSWDSIKTREYSIDGGVTWTTTKPTVLSLTSLPANQASKDFNIGFKVTDTGHIYSGSLTSTSVFKTVRVYRNNNKPIALFTVTPSIAKINSTLTYSDTSYDPDPWGTITERVWEYRKVKDISGNPVIDTWKLGKPTVINDYGFFEIRLKVKDNGNGILAPLWSDYYTQIVKISKSDLIIKEMKILDINNDTEPTYLLQGNSYRIKATVKNIGEVSSEGNIIRFSNSSNVEIDRSNVPTLLASQETSIIVDYTQEAGGANYIINAKVDNENVVTELREDNNTSSATKSLYIKDLITDNIIIKDASGNAVTSMIQGHSYSVNVTNKNSGTIAITEGFNIGLKINDVLQGARKSIVGGILVGASSVEGKWTLTPPLNISAYQAYKLDGIADVDSTVWETYENNNIKTTNINAYYQNLKPTLIDIVGENDDTSKIQLQQGKKYRVKFIVKNDGQTNVGAFAINVRETNSNLSIGTLNCSGLNANTSTTTHYMTFTANGRGNMNFEVFADSGLVIKESNEDDNKLSTARTGFRLNLKTTSIDIVGRNDTITKNSLTQNIQYRAAITIANDGDIDISNSVVGLYENTSNVVTSATKLGTTNLTIAKGETKTVYVPFIPQNRGPRTFIGVADDSKVVDESDELDNEAYTNRTVNKVNIKAVIMDIQDTNGVTQTLLQKGKNYNAKIQLINDGDANIGAFNLGLYDNNVQIGSLPISGLPKAATPTVYTIAFIPQNGGARTFEAFADDKLQIEESNETDNKLQSVLSVNIIQLINYRITSMVNPPKVYSYPIDINRMPVEVKSGYNVTFQIDVIGIADSVTADFTDSSGLNNKTVNFKKVIDIDPFYSVWEATVNTDMNTPLNTIIYSTVVGKRETEVYNYNTSNNWGGATLLIKGSALEDFNINRIY